MVLIPESVTAFRELHTSEGHLSKLLFTKPSFLDTSSEIVENESNCGWLLSNSSDFVVAENIGIMVDSDLESLSAVSESDGSIPFGDRLLFPMRLNKMKRTMAAAINPESIATIVITSWGSPSEVAFGIESSITNRLLLVTFGELAIFLANHPNFPDTTAFVKGFLFNHFTY